MAEHTERMTMSKLRPREDSTPDPEDDTNSPPAKRRRIEAPLTVLPTAPSTAIAVANPTIGVRQSDSRALPNEIWNLILGYSSRKDLLQVSLVSKRLHEVASEFLYAEFNGSIDHISELAERSWAGHDNPYYPIEITRPAVFDKVTSFLRAIAHQPHLADFVRQLTFGQAMNDVGELKMTRMSKQAQNWIIKTVKPGNFSATLDEGNGGAQGEVTITMDYLFAVDLLIHLCHQKLKVLDMQGSRHWAPLVTNKQRMSATPALHLDRFQIASSRLCDNGVDHLMIDFLKLSAPKTFVAMTKTLPWYFFEYPELDINTVELQDCYLEDKFLRSIRCLEVLKWQGLPRAYDSSFFGFLTSMNTSPHHFKTNLRELVIEKLPLDNMDRAVDINLSAYSNLKSLTITSSLAFDHLHPDIAPDVDIPKVIDVFMARVPTCLQQLTIADTHQPLQGYLTHLVSHKMRRHRDLVSIRVTFCERGDDGFTESEDGQYEYTELAKSCGVEVEIHNGFDWTSCLRSKFVGKQLHL